VARKYTFNPPKIRFHLNIKLPTNATRKSEKRLEKIKELIGSMPLQLSYFGDMPLQKSNLEICHSNLLIPLPTKTKLHTPW
jgi:hypothetical protein